jgi:hypothetical protein
MFETGHTNILASKDMPIGTLTHAAAHLGLVASMSAGQRRQWEAQFRVIDKEVQRLSARTGLGHF